MAEENDPVEPQGGGGEPEIDWKAEARKWERRSKENADKARAYDELQEQSKTELEKAREQAASYKKQVGAQRQGGARRRPREGSEGHRRAGRADLGRRRGVHASVRRGRRQVGQAAGGSDGSSRASGHQVLPRDCITKTRRQFESY